jgi:hypothetical protein
MSEYMGVSLSLLPVWKDIPVLSGWHEQGGSPVPAVLAQADGADAAVCGDLLDIWIELSKSKHDSEWL